MRHPINTLIQWNIGFILMSVFMTPTFGQSHSEQLVEKGITAQNNQDVTYAIDLYTLAIDVNPNYVDAYWKRYESYLAKGMPHKAICDLNAIIHQNPYDMNAIVKRGALYFDLEEYDKALYDYNTLLQYRKTAETYKNIAWIYRAQGDIALSYEYFHKAIDIDPTMGEAYCGIADIFAENGNYPEAFEYYAQALDYNSQDALSWINRGKLNLSLGRIKDAIYDFNTSLNLEKKSEAYVYLTQAYLKNQEWNNAQSAISQAFRYEEESGEAYYTLGLVEYTIGKHKAAYHSFEVAVGYKPKEAKFLKHYGLAAYQLERPYEAVTAFNEYLDVVSNDPEVENIMEKCYTLIANIPQTASTTTTRQSPTNYGEPMPTYSTDSDFTDDVFNE